VLLPAQLVRVGRQSSRRVSATSGDWTRSMSVSARRPMSDAGDVDGTAGGAASSLRASPVNDGIIGCFVRGVKLIQ